MRLLIAAVAAIVLTAAWAGFAQVPDKAKEKPSTPAKKPADATRPNADNAKKAEPPVKSGAADKKKPNEPPAETADDADEREIRKGAEAFVAAYNAHDAKALAELFFHRAELVDEDGALLEGRDAIERDFAETFRQFPECRIRVDTDSVRLLTPNIAVEEGVVRGQPLPDEDENVSTYLAVHVKTDGRWLVVSVRDFAAEPEGRTAGENLQDLEWMIGDWIDERGDSVVKSSWRWDESGNYLLHDYVVRLEGGQSLNGSMRVGWDPLTRQLKSWTFDADSSYSEALWGRDGDEWILRSRGVNGEGATTSASHVFRYVDKDTMTWRAFDRAVGGIPVDDIPEQIIKRDAPQPQE